MPASRVKNKEAVKVLQVKQQEELRRERKERTKRLKIKEQQKGKKEQKMLLLRRLKCRRNSKKNKEGD